MPDNLAFSIVANTDKARAELSLLQAELRKTTAELKKASDAAVRSGDRTRVNELSSVYEALRLRTAGAARGLHAVSAANREVAATSQVSVREIAKISRELGKLELSGFAVSKMFREFPKVAIPVAIAAGVGTAIAKLSTDAYKAITALDDLATASGFAGSQIIGLEKTFAAADVGADVLNKTLLSIGETFDKAKIKAGDLGSMMYGVQTFRGPAGAAATGYGPGGRATQSTTPGLSNYVAPAPQGVGPGVGAFQQGVAVMRGGQPLGLDPSKGFAGLVDPTQFRTVEEFFAAAQRALLQINKFSPMLAREILRGQGLEPVATLRGLAGTTAEAFAAARQQTLSDPRLRGVPLARQFGGGAKEAGAATERGETEAGISAMEAAIPALKTYGTAVEAVGEQIKKTREEAGQLNDALTKGPDSGELGATTNAFAGAWTAAFDQIRNSWNATAASMSALPGGGGSQEGQVIPIAPPGGMATGGMVSGRGTRDTVPAWLTPGEYVNRRASVAYYGSGLFSALNNRAIPRSLFSRVGYATGGLVGNIASFAQGGSVGGRPVHLHIGSGSFPLSGSGNVVEALVSAAHSQQIRSAGTKPSWFAARPSGQ